MNNRAHLGTSMIPTKVNKPNLTPSCLLVYRKYLCVVDLLNMQSVLSLPYRTIWATGQFWTDLVIDLPYSLAQFTDLPLVLGRRHVFLHDGFMLLNVVERLCRC
eukprot:TRINITY_DN11352_c0_g1_i3.p1 TRINITY_DN11352_c0_g1~~TRINITY_DN11352_c0_g1_i3.p1  ORF type:complete len:104 (-),score=7.59 TRINITY_DN11352_c0_g1_i3:53-364(-)